MKRLDVALVERGLCATREKAQRAILAGQVQVNRQLAHKPSDRVTDSDHLSLLQPEKYVSRGGFKLEHALQALHLDVQGLTAIDVGASTGGFTDCLLQHGAAKVFAVDVGRGQLAWKIRNDPRVVVMEKTNARELRPELFPQPFTPLDLAVLDCSFISLRKILSPVIALLRPSANIVALLKPQFEAGKAEADRGAGVITDPAIHQRVIRELQEYVGAQPGWRWRGVVESPLLGPAGNKEFWFGLKKLTSKCDRIGLIANPEKVVCRRIVRQTAARIKAAGRSVLADSATAQLAGLKIPAAPSAAQLAPQVDLLMIFGGDGTILRIAREIAGSETPLLCINVGGLGFLTDVQSHQVPLALKQIWAGETLLQTRPLIEASGHAGPKEISCLALNDFVITRGAAPRLIELEVSVDGEVMTRYRCDGVIVCSPTGSTAYSMAAGGAIVNPSAEVFSLTPICPHTLSNRSVIISLNSVVEVKVLSRRVETVLTADGQPPIPLAPGNTIRICRSRHSVRLLHLAGSSFFTTLRRKLNWMGSHV